MIPDFEYYRPSSAEEAALTWTSLAAAGKRPLYYGGGTEIITMCRAGSLNTGAVVDLKGIADARKLGFSGDTLEIGACVTLSEISESGLFPLLGAVGGRVADHTVQCKITLGGNIAGTIIYKEASLPLMLCDATASVWGSNGRREVPFSDIFQGSLSLDESEFLLGVSVHNDYINAPWFHQKRTKMEEIGYPLLTLVGLRAGEEIRTAVSGMYAEPLRLPSVDCDAAENAEGASSKASESTEALREDILNDLDAGPDYRRLVFGHVLTECFCKLGAA